jgi:hypothetical protein
MTLPGTFFACWQQRIPNSLFRKKYRPIFLFRRAQRLVLAIDRLSAAVSNEAPGAEKNPALTQLFEDVRSRADFQAPRFVEHLRRFRATLSPTKQ